MADLLSVDEALARTLARIARLPAESVPLARALNRVLAEPVAADQDSPPFANSSMDGFAVRAGDTEGASPDGPARLRVAFDIPAGSAPPGALNPGEAARIMTGAPLPPGADAVVPVEASDARFSVDEAAPAPSAVAIFRAARPGQYVRPAGEDFRAGETLLRAGTELRPADLGLLAALGRAEVQVVGRPRVSIVSTGDELVPPGEPLAPGKIRDSNAVTLAALVEEQGGEPVSIPAARDTLDDTRRRFREALDAAPDVVLSSAGVSVGAFDVVRAVLAELGAVDFWRINLRPGKPLAFGQLAGVPFFGLPGNPVSAMVTFDVFVRPALRRLGGRPEHARTATAVTGVAMESDGRRSYIRVTLTRANGKLVAMPTGTQSSGALRSMALADGLLIIPENVTEVPAGTALMVRLLRDVE